MAEFGAQATQLSDPKGMGASQVAPVQGIDFGDMARTVVSIFKMGDSEPEQLKQYSSELENIAQGIDNGSLSSARGMSEARRVHAKYAGRYPQYTKEIKSIHESFMTGSTIGVAAEEEKSVRELRRQDISDASKAGWDIPYGASTNETDAIVAAYKAKKRNQEATDTMMKDLRFKREQQNWTNDDADRKIKEDTAVLLASSTGAYIDGFNAIGSSLARQVSTNPESAPIAQAKLAEHYARIRGEIAAIASVNPGLASNYTSLFNELYDTNKKLLDPASQSEDQLKLLKTQLDMTKTKLQSLALKSPSTQRAYVISTLIGQPSVINSLGDLASQEVGVLMMQENPPVGRVPVVGNPDVEKNVFNASSEALKGLMNGTFVVQKERSEQESVNLANNLLNEIGGFIDKGQSLSPKMLDASLDWASRSEVGAAAKAGKLNPQARMAAKKVFEIGMMQPLVSKIDEKLRNAPSKSGFDSELGKHIIDLISEVSFDGANVKVQFNDAAKKSPAGIASVKQDLRSSEVLVTKLVKAAAHMEGHTDYQKTWEAIRSKVFPSLYASPTQLQVGQTFKSGNDTYEYLGGPDGRASSWRKLTTLTK